MLFRSQSSASAVEIRINGSATSTSINDYACIYPHIMDLEEIRVISSEMPNQKDNSAVYQNSTEAGPQNAAQNNTSPFSLYTSNPATASRASFVCKQVAYDAVNRYAVYQFDLVEQLYISPMTWGKYMDKSSGLSLLNNLMINIRFADINRLISAVPDANNTLSLTFANSITTPGGVVNGSEFNSPTLLLEYITPDPILASKMPSTLAYDYSLLQTFISPAGAYASGTEDNTTFTAQSLRLSSLPRRLYVFARPSKSALNKIGRAHV